MTEGRFTGMTINERLFECGRLEEFQEAALRRNRPEMVRLLSDLELSIAEVAQIVDAILVDPPRFGF